MNIKKIILILLIVVIVLILVITGIFFYNQKIQKLNIARTELEQKMKDESGTTEDSHGNIKSILWDLNNDINNEKIEFDYIYKNSEINEGEEYVSSMKAILVNGDNKYIINFPDKVYMNIRIEIVDIDETDNFKEILVSYSPSETNLQVAKNFFIKYNGYKFEFIKTNYSNSASIKTMYVKDKKPENYIMSATERVGETLIAKDGMVKSYSMADQEETFKLNVNGELELIDSGFAGTKEQYKQYFETWGAGIVYVAKDESSETKKYGNQYEVDIEGIIPTTGIDVLQIDKYWIDVIVNGENGYINFSTINNTPAIQGE